MTGHRKEKWTNRLDEIIRIKNLPWPGGQSDNRFRDKQRILMGKDKTKKIKCKTCLKKATASIWNKSGNCDYCKQDLETTKKMVFQMKCDNCKTEHDSIDLSSCMTDHAQLEDYGVNGLDFCNDFYCDKCLNKNDFCPHCAKHIPDNIQIKVCEDYNK